MLNLRYVSEKYRASERRRKVSCAGNTENCERIIAATGPGEGPGLEVWGLLTSIDLENCDPGLVRSAGAIREFTSRLCSLIKMKPFGECHVVHFGQDEKVEGFSMFQLIETSCISGHFANATNRAYLDVFSCKMYEPTVVAEFAKEFFKGSKYRMHVTERY